MYFLSNQHFLFLQFPLFPSGTSARIVIKKVIWDQLTLPIPLTMFFTSMAVIKAKTDVFADLKVRKASANLE